MKRQYKDIVEIAKEQSRNYKKRKKFERYLQKLMDKGWIKSWYWNGKYIVDFKWNCEGMTKSADN